MAGPLRSDMPAKRSFCDCSLESRANACLIFHCALVKSLSGWVMLQWAPQVCSL